MHLTFKTKKNGCEFLTFYIRRRSAVDSAQWNRGIMKSVGMMCGGWFVLAKFSIWLPNTCIGQKREWLLHKRWIFVVCEWLSLCEHSIYSKYNSVIIFSKFWVFQWHHIYADDIVLLSETEEELQKLIDKVYE